MFGIKKKLMLLELSIDDLHAQLHYQASLIIRLERKLVELESTELVAALHLKDVPVDE